MSNLAEKKYPEPLVELVDGLVEMLTEKYGIGATEATTLAWDIVGMIAIEWSGQQVYISRSVAISESDRAVVRDLDSGMTHGAVATKHSITERSVFNVLKRVRAEEDARNQIQLPFCGG